MLRASLAILATILLVTVLSVLIVESRAVKDDYYVAHAERMRAIETSRNDLNTIIQGTEGAFDDGRQVSESTEFAFFRLAESNASLQRSEQRLLDNAAVAAQLLAFDSKLRGFVRDGQAFASEVLC